MTTGMTTGTDTKRERARPLSAQERRAAIIAATLPLLGEPGAEVTTRRIADAAGVAEGTIFRVFADKRELFLAVGEEVLSPAGAREALTVGLTGCPGLREKVVVATEQLVERNRRVMQVMMSLRSVLLAEGHATHEHSPDHRGRAGGPPAFVRASHEGLLTDLVDLVFAPHAAELRVSPQRAARVLRALVLGTWHPALSAADDTISADELADVVLEGVER